ncbi:sulfurtransferase TusA family protein [Garciella nitratireducens]|uniref:TusA-related sulfurtransferase n=1 Tax=Garciella nitratireducens DSM 15102 TaxID=1121911 RepID=A0A1T4L294_9FIRM|nr:sulfurtransferase TusA family protein [Garciella nitratireducens]SJZ48718.1 TusA-related sulfurtransferase [Garciella nitratireducens DSM 15102]
MKTIDCLGDMCPIPILKAQKALKLSPSGTTIKVVTDHSCTLESMLNHFKKYEITSTEVINGVWEIFITKS